MKTVFEEKIKNHGEFAQWLNELKNQDKYVIVKQYDVDERVRVKGRLVNTKGCNLQYVLLPYMSEQFDLHKLSLSFCENVVQTTYVLDFIHGYNIGVFDFVKICSGEELDFESSCVEIPRKATMLEVFKGEHECGFVIERYNLS